MDEDEGVSFLERLLAGRCKPSHHMVPLILVACSLWRLWDSRRVQKELVPEESKGGLERIGGKGIGGTGLKMVSVGRRQVRGEALLQPFP